MNIYRVKSRQYIDYLSKYDRKVSWTKQDSQYGRKYIGTVITIGRFIYFAPLSSSMWKKDINGNYLLDKQGKKILKKNFSDILLFDNDPSNPAGAVKLNNMIPLTNEIFNSILELEDIEKYKSSSKQADHNYAMLLEKQVKLINGRYDQAIVNKANEMYNRSKSGLEQDKKVKMVCCNFELLEQKALKYEHKRSNKPD